MTAKITCLTVKMWVPFVAGRYIIRGQPKMALCNPIRVTWSGQYPITALLTGSRGMLVANHSPPHSQRVVTRVQPLAGGIEGYRTAATTLVLRVITRACTHTLYQGANLLNIRALFGSIFINFLHCTFVKKISGSHLFQVFCGVYLLPVCWWTIRLVLDELAACSLRVAKRQIWVGLLFS